MTTKTATKTADLSVPAIPHSSMPSIHKSGGPLGEALRAIPEWVHGVEQLAHLAAIRPAHQHYASAGVELDAMVAAAVEDRTSLSVEDALTLARKVTDRIAGQQALENAIDRQAQALTERLDALTRAHLEGLYDHLTTHLQGLVERARDHAAFLTMDAETALNRGEGQRWQEAQELLAQMRRLRASRLALEREAGGWSEPGAQVYVELRWLANPTEVMEHWREWRIDGALVNPRDIADRKALTAPWPDQRYRTSTNGEAEEWLMFYATHPTAVPWVPSPQQYAQRTAELREHMARRAVA